MNIITLPLVNLRHQISKLKGFAYLLFEAFMRAYFDAYMKTFVPIVSRQGSHDEDFAKLHKVGIKSPKKSQKAT